MPIMAIYRRDGISAELYNKYRASAPIDEVPRGALAHAYGRSGSGFVAIDIWEDPRAMDRYIRGVVIPATDVAQEVEVAGIVVLHRLLDEMVSERLSPRMIVLPLAPLP